MATAGGLDEKWAGGVRGCGRLRIDQDMRFTRPAGVCRRPFDRNERLGGH